MPLLAAPAPSTAFTSQTIVSLTFDDGDATQYQVRSILAQRGMRATFFINSGLVAASDYFMTWNQIQGLAADGNEIGGHTLDHADLTKVSTEEARRQICADRSALIARGFSVTSFAYPYGAYNATVKTLVRDCGYSSGRSAGGLCGTAGCTWAPYGERIPPSDAYAIRVPGGGTWATPSEQAATLRGFVERAEQSGGGWVPLLLHNVCECGSNGISPTALASFLDWLKARQSTTGTALRTVHEVISGAAPPASQPAALQLTTSSLAGGTVGAAYSQTLSASGGTTPYNWSLTGALPPGLQLNTSSGVISGTPTSAGTWSFTAGVADSGSPQQTASRSLSIAVAPPAPSGDSTPPTTTISCNGGACVNWFTSSVAVSLSASDDTGVKATRYTVDGSEPGASSAAYTGPFSVETTTTVKFRSWDAAGNVEPTQTRVVRIDTVPPTVTITNPLSGATVDNRVTVTVDARDTQSGIRHVQFFLDGNLIGTSNSPPYRVVWHAKKAVPGEHTLTAVAYDVAGRSTTSVPVRVLR